MSVANKRERVKCPRPDCGYEWKPRVDNPVECPLCKRYLASKWNKSEEERGSEAKES